MFLDSDLYRPLYDVSEGGKPRGFQCQLVKYPENVLCYRVTRTARGMASHLWRVHGMRLQGEFNFEEAKLTKF